ncbi:hypothetical protein [Dolichospermum circinale]|uniref:hypothetical protein n=1 Tax=Dolichospermum circinale TaxID=109265 RepID=UPI00232C6B6C|nr:hypothetical protein [Dolichospermum circinale]MDB9452211.1 hypothetical protein [Dolichospermum circinale CS-547]
MDVNEALQFADQLVFKHTDKHLDSIQKAVVEGTWQRDTYEDIAKKYNLTEKHLSDVGYKLWSLLSEALGEDIKKTNFRSTFERLNIELSQNPNICIGTNHYFNFSSQTINNSNQKNQESDINTESKLSSYDLTLAPEIVNFYQRKTELEKLSNWIFKQNTRLISVSGLYGTGKTTLVKRFIDLKSVSILINKNYDGQVADFLAENTLHITNQMQSRFRDVLNHLSPQEKEIVWHLSKLDIPITRDSLKEGLNLSVVDFNNGLQSLQERYLVRKVRNSTILFQLSSVFREYVRNYCQDLGHIC